MAGDRYRVGSEDDTETSRYGAPAVYNARQAAALKFQQQQERLPLKDALAIAQLQKSQAQAQFEGRAQLDRERTEANTLRQGAAFYASKPVLEKYLRNQVA